jgi:hypothetical protein
MIDRLFLTGMFGLLCLSAAYAQTEPVPVYPGARLVWNYEWTVPGDGFPIQVDGQWTKKVPPEAREIPLTDLNLTDGPHRIEIRARAADGRVSPWAGIGVIYSSTLPDPLPPPDTMRIIMEWGTE